MDLKHLLKILPLLLFSAFSQAKMQQLEPQVLLKLIQDQQAPLILDVRSTGEFQQGHIQGAINISYDLLGAKSELLNDYKNRLIVVYCRSGRRAQVAYQILQKKGFKQLIDLKGHMILWQQRQYPLVR
ncbi:rhodanese-like domain-containing protein [Psychromonas hadalis]|uniref:rhodanese-like domain-containing protein n=1 Tax=Psychromonas hadalis TaxID=211669 RepID=UPI0003B4FA80|nr:rhodanese-like domain-containing protein [Psychromonas hadalis]